MAARETTRSVPIMGPGALVGFALWRDAMAWQRRVDSALRSLGLTHTRVLVLSALDAAIRRTGEAVSQVVIAAEAGLDKVTVSAVLRALESGGFVDRDVGYGDRRAWRVRITSNGKRVLASAVPLVEEASSGLPRHRR